MDRSSFMPEPAGAGRSTRSTNAHTNRRRSARFEALLNTPARNEHNADTYGQHPPHPTDPLVNPHTDEETRAYVDDNLDIQSVSDVSSDASDDYIPPKEAPAPHSSSRKRRASNSLSTNPTAKRPRGNGKKTAPIPVEERLQGIGPIPLQENRATESCVDNEEEKRDWGSHLHRKRGENGSSCSPVWKYAYPVAVDPTNLRAAPSRCPVNAPVLSQPPTDSTHVSCRICNAETDENLSSP
jgi:hypothetical protein